MQLEEVGQPEDILHQVHVFAFALRVSRGPEHIVAVDEVEHDLERLCHRPERQQNAYLLALLDLGDDVAELGALLKEILLEGRELDVFDYEANLVGVRIVTLLVRLVGSSIACLRGRVPHFLGVRRAGLVEEVVVWRIDILRVEVAILGFGLTRLTVLALGV